MTPHHTGTAKTCLNLVGHDQTSTLPNVVRDRGEDTRRNRRDPIGGERWINKEASQRIRKGLSGTANVNSGDIRSRGVIFASNCKGGLGHAVVGAFYHQ